MHLKNIYLQDKAPLLAWSPSSILIANVSRWYAVVFNFSLPPVHGRIEFQRIARINSNSNNLNYKDESKQRVKSAQINNNDNNNVTRGKNVYVTTATFECEKFYDSPIKPTKSKYASFDICSYGYFLTIARIAYPWCMYHNRVPLHFRSITMLMVHSDGQYDCPRQSPSVQVPTIDRASACNLHSRVAIRL